MLIALRNNNASLGILIVLFAFKNKIQLGSCKGKKMNRREFTIAGMAAITAAATNARASDYEVLLGRLDLDIGQNEVLVQTGAAQSAIRLGKCAFLFAPYSKIKFDVRDGLAVKAAHLIRGAMHSVFDPNEAVERAVITSHATIGIRGTAHYIEIEEDQDRTYSCCCYGHIHVDGGVSQETQKTNYHDARVIGRDGEVKASPYSVPLNHFDDSLVYLEKSVGRTPRWKLPNGKMQFISPLDLN